MIIGRDSCRSLPNFFDENAAVVDAKYRLIICAGRQYAPDWGVDNMVVL